MLYKLECNKLRKGTIHFHEGLNIILGDEEASNSIGKTSALKLINLCFGSDDINDFEEISNQYGGDLEIKFIHRFDKEEFIFSRRMTNTNQIECLTTTDEVPKYMTCKEFCTFLKKKYNIRDEDLSFRTAANQTIRIWKSTRKDTALPEYTNKTEAVKNLVKLYDLYSDLKQYDNSIKLKDDYSKAKKLIANKEKAPQSKKDIKLLEQKLSELNEKKNSLSERIVKNDTSDLTAEELEYRRQRTKLCRDKHKIEDKIKRTEFNLITNHKNVGDLLYQIEQFFPNIDIRKISEIQTFHEKISEILKTEILLKIDELNYELKNKEIEIEKLDAANIGFINNTAAEEIELNNLIQIIDEIKNIQILIENYNQRKELEKQIKELKEKRRNEATTVYKDISLRINDNIFKINQNVYGPRFATPVFEITDNGSYNYEIENDTGTGRRYYSFIILDQTIANTSDAPYIIHDSYVFKNIEYERINNLLSYYPTEKQSFISIDGESIHYADDQTIKNNTVLRLSKKETLFNKKWNEND